MLNIIFIFGARGENYEDALEKFESVLGSKPESSEASVASYNVACCYSKLNQVLIPSWIRCSFSDTYIHREISLFIIGQNQQILRCFQVQAGLSALDDAMQAGYKDFKLIQHSPLCSHTLYCVNLFFFPPSLQTIRNDPDLANLTASEESEPLMKKYDESFINESAINAIKSLFGFNKN